MSRFFGSQPRHFIMIPDGTVYALNVLQHQNVCVETRLRG
jgi:hypothetical protein